MNARQHGFCMRCSGNASMFWEKQGDVGYFKIKSSFCKALVPECAPILANTTMFSQFFKATRMMQNAAQGTLAGTTLDPFGYRPFPEMSLNPVFDGVELFNDTKLKKLIECGFEPAKCVSDEDKLKVFCENFSFMWLNHAIEGNYLVLRDAMLM